MPSKFLALFLPSWSLGFMQRVTLPWLQAQLSLRPSKRTPKRSGLQQRQRAALLSPHHLPDGLCWTTQRQPWAVLPLGKSFPEVVLFRHTSKGGSGGGGGALPAAFRDSGCQMNFNLIFSEDIQCAYQIWGALYTAAIIQRSAMKSSAQCHIHPFQQRSFINLGCEKFRRAKSLSLREK